MRFLQELTRQQAVEEDREHDSPIDNVIRAYALIAQANVMTGMQQHVPCDDMSYHLRIARMAYQRLLSAAHTSQGRVTNDMDDGAIDTQELEETFHEILEEEDSMDMDDGEEEIEELGEARLPARGKQPKYVRLQSLPNVHAGLHVKNNVSEYATVMNCSVLAGELKHKYV